jgi:endoglucanase
MRKSPTTRLCPAKRPLVWHAIWFISFSCAPEASGQTAAQERRSGELVGINTVGYRPKSVKRAIASGGEVFVVRDAQTGAEVYRGQLTESNSNDAGNRQLFIADFSDLSREGAYQIEVPGVGKSATFRVADDVFNWPFYCVARAIYLWRCGTRVSATLGADTYTHEACHENDAHLDHVGGPAGARSDTAGGWHDAGDYNKYSVNGAFTAGTLLRAYEHFPDQLARVKLDIPESGNQVPDLLDEVRWELEWLLKMQADDGRVYHKVSTLHYGGFVLPEKETEPRFVSPWSSSATASFAAVMAQAARVFQPIDAAFSQQCLDAAKKSYGFFKTHPHEHRPDLSAFSTGGYVAPDADDRTWAAAELWETTGDVQYLHDFETRIGGRQNGAADQPRATVDIDWDWSNLRNLGVFTYLLSQREGRDPALVERIRNDAIRAADAIVDAAKSHPYGRPLGSKYYWGCNGTVARQTINLQVAYRLTNDARYLTAMLDAISHLLGRNLYGRSYVTGLGHRPPRFPHDRRSGGDNIDAPWPGNLVGGPWPSAGDWRDDQDDYRTNEIAINWNGALIYALAAFVDPDSFDESVAAMKQPAKDMDTTSLSDNDE